MNVQTARASWDMRKDEAMVHAIRHVRLPLCITDPNLPDNPIVFINAAFSELTGYSEDEVIGRNCRFLQGADTTPQSVERARDIIENTKVETVEIVNYRKDGTRFVNALQMGPILDDDGQLIFYFGSQLDITAQRAEEERARALANRELLHRLKNIANVMMVIIRMTAREETDPAILGEKLVGRLGALSEAHFATLKDDKGAEVFLGDLAATLLSTTAPLGTEQFSVSGPKTKIPRAVLSAVTLALHELATNSVKHGALGARDGRVDLSWRLVPGADAAMIEMSWDESGGPEVRPPSRENGTSIITTMVQAAGGEMAFDWRTSGLHVTLSYPVIPGA